MESYEKLGAFYLGKTYDQAQGKVQDDLLLYDAKDLTTHAVCVGMTGSGKTGLCVSLLEEAAIDGIPAIAIDPKGDLGNLMLTFPKLRAEDFRPWVDPAEAARKGMDPDAYAADRAKLWKNGLAGWGQTGERIERFRRAAEVSIYTPGSEAGLPLSVIRSFRAPTSALAADAEAMRERNAAAVSGLLALLGIDADPIRSREHILLSNIIDHAWRAGRDLDIPALIQEIQQPPMQRVGVMDLESFFPSSERFGLAMALNNLLASPGFSSWMEGEPLDIDRLLYTEQGRPRLSILSIAHLSEAQRMFFVTILLNELVAWMRQQSGTSSLRAILYMDEIFGFFPPTANPPSKQPMLTLLKQARAYGLGCVLATQNPVDLDYKGLSNTGTWFLGRLQTERDKMRVLEGLEGASSAAGSNFNRAEMEATLAGLGSRVFMMNNVHEDQPVLFHTRWALSYLRGPLTRGQIQTLMAPRRAEHAVSAPAPTAPPAPPTRAPAAPAWGPAPTAPAWGPAPTAPAWGTPPTAPAWGTAPSAPPPAPVGAPLGASQRAPTVPPGVLQRFLPVDGDLGRSERLVYRPALVGISRLHFVRTGAKIDEWREVALTAPLDEDTLSEPWEAASQFLEIPALEKKPHGGAVFTALPAGAAQAKKYKTWKKALVDHLYRTHEMTLLHCRELKRYSEPDQPEREFRVALRQQVHERRDLAVEKLRKKYGPKLDRLKESIRKAEARVGKEAAQAKQAGLQTALSLGTTVLGALFGRKKMSVGTVGRAATTLRGAGRTAREKGDIARAEETAEATRLKLAALEEEFQLEIARVREDASIDDLEFDEIIVRPRKGDMRVRELALTWLPHRQSADGLVEPMFSGPE